MVVTLLSVGIVGIVPEVTGAGHIFALATFPFAVGVVITIHQLRRQFNVPLLLIRSSPNWYAGAAGGATAFVGSLLISAAMQRFDLAKSPSILLFAMTLIMFVSLTTYGAVLRDIADGEIEVDTDTG